ncbi:MAG: hypothetical protein H0T07_02085 [Actinobacteria bacterium]|nr:hypothetical protein [Actinomycetota bacterium]
MLDERAGLRHGFIGLSRDGDTQRNDVVGKLVGQRAEHRGKEAGLAAAACAYHRHPRLASGHSSQHRLGPAGSRELVEGDMKEVEVVEPVGRLEGAAAIELEEIGKAHRGTRMLSGGREWSGDVIFIL